jgi:hypothetical protein
MSRNTIKSKTPKSPLSDKAIEVQESVPKTLPAIALPISLNILYKDQIKSVQDCLLFLEHFCDEPAIRKLIEIYKSNSDNFSPHKLDLDALAQKADISRIEFRRIINNSLDILCHEGAEMVIRTYKEPLVKASLERAMNTSDPYTERERDKWVEYYGFRIIKDKSQLSVNLTQTNTQTTIQQNVSVGGLPSFSETIQEGEKSASETIKGLITKSQDTLDIENKQIIDISAKEIPNGQT